MEEQLKNSVFRFITLRAPETSDDSLAPTTYYVAHPNIAESGLYGNLTSKKSFTEAVQGFNEVPYTSTAALKNAFPALYQFAGWLSRNRNVVSNTVIQANRGIAQPVDHESLLALWDSFLYQAGTQADPYLRDMTAKILIADKLLRDWLPNPPAWTPEQLQAAAAAKILMPKEILGTNGHYLDNTSGTVSSSLSFTGSKAHTQALDALVAQDSAARHAKALAEIAVIHAAYEKSQNAALLSFQQAQDSVKSETSDTEDHSLPVFVPAPQMSRAVLSEKLSPEAFYAVDKLGLMDNTTFEEAKLALTGKAKEDTGVVFEKSISGKTVVVAAGAGMEVKTTGATAVPYGFTARLIPVAENTYKVALVVNTDEKDPGIVSAAYTTGNKTVTAVTDYAIDNYLGVILHPDGITVAEGTQSINVSGDLQLTGGITATLNVDLPVTTIAVNGKLVPVFDASGGGNTAGGPVPAAHGIRRLGIADYRTLEQTVCCYVPGEVSHIENIMAREYKERSTRRLRRSEDTTTTDTQTEKEHLSDTSSAERNEMQKEATQVLAESTSLGVATGANVNYSGGMVNAGFNFSANYASNMSKQQSDRQAVNFAKEVTERASDKINQKISDQRISKIIEEFEEQDKHGFDNRGDNAVNLSGVYRWVDKVYKNQVVNYGTRMMYEFMIPEPAVFHKEAMNAIPAEAVQVTKPVDPRTAGLQRIETAQKLDRTNYAYWAAMYNVTVTAPPDEFVYAGKSFSYSGWAGNTNNGNELYDAKDTIRIPEGYTAIGARIMVSAVHDGEPLTSTQKHGISVNVGNLSFVDNAATLTSGAALANRRWECPTPSPLNGYTQYMPMDPYENEVAVSLYGINYPVINANVSLKLQLSRAAFEKWQTETYNAILKAYEVKLAEYNKAFADAQAKTAAAKETNPMYYRIIEQTVLKKNCIAYLVSQNYMGQEHITGAGTVATVMPGLTAQMDNYGAVVQFMEQAFEWEIMSYSFFPFYWAKKDKWASLYNYNNDDPIFRAFMQSGMARVVVTVRPGFEEAVMYYMSTGQVWNGGDAPVVDDPLYRTVMRDLHAAPGVVEETWETKVPTTLTVIQASSVGLNTTGLPCDEACGDAQYFFSSDARLERLEEKP